MVLLRVEQRHFGVVAGQGAVEEYHESCLDGSPDWILSELSDGGLGVGLGEKQQRQSQAVGMGVKQQMESEAVGEKREWEVGCADF